MLTATAPGTSPTRETRTEESGAMPASHASHVLRGGRRLTKKRKRASGPQTPILAYNGSIYQARQFPQNGPVVMPPWRDGS